MESQSFMKPLTSFIQGISIFTSEMSDAVFYETKLCLTYILIFLTFLPRVKLQSQQTNNGFKSKNGIVGYLSGDFFHYLPFFWRGGVRLILCLTGQGPFSVSLTNYYCWKSSWIDSRATFCLLTVGRHSGISIVLECWLAYTDSRLKIDVVSTGLLGRFWQIGWWSSDHVYELRETYYSLPVDKRRLGVRRRLAADICVNRFGAMHTC